MSAKVIVAFLIVRRFRFRWAGAKKVQKKQVPFYPYLHNRNTEFSNPPILRCVCNKVERLERFLVYLSDAP